MSKQPSNNRTALGRFAPGNSLGKRWKPGESGNPAGRPKSAPLARELRARLAEDDGKLIAELVAVAIREALAGDFRYWREIIDRVDGPVLARVALNITDDDDGEPPRGYSEMTPEERAAALAAEMELLEDARAKLKG